MPVNNRSDRLLRLLLPLHEAPHARDAWEVTLSGLARLIRCEQAAMIERDGARTTDAIAFGAGSDDRFNQEYRSQFSRIDPFATDDAQARMLRAGRGLRLDEVVPRDHWQGSSFYLDYWRRYGVADGLVAAVTITGRRHANFCALFGRGREPQREERALFDLFVGHARAALRQRHAIAQRDAALRSLLSAGDCLADAVFVVDGEGTLIQCNAAADELIDSGEVVRLRGGELRLGRSSSGSDPLVDLLQALTARRQRGASDEPVRCLAIREGGPADELLVTAVRMAKQPSRGSPAAVLFLRRGREARKLFQPQHLRDLFGFTPAETRIANALLAGERVEDIAARMGVRADTVRGHVKRMLAKTGTRRQSELVTRLAAAVPNLRVFSN